MTRRIVFVVALLAALAMPAALAEEFTTSRGTYSLWPLSSIANESQLRQATGDAERAITALLADIQAIEASRSVVATELSAIAPQVQAEQAAVDRAKAAFDTIDKKYLADLAAFQQKQVDLESEIQRQRGEAANLQALPSAQRDYASVDRLNRWARDISAKRDAIAAERERLLVDHAAVEAERLKVAKMRADAEARLIAKRDSGVDRFGQESAQLERTYGQLRRAIAYLDQALALGRSKYAGAPRTSAVLEGARNRLRAYDNRKATR